MVDHDQDARAQRGAGEGLAAPARPGRARRTHGRPARSMGTPPSTTADRLAMRCAAVPPMVAALLVLATLGTITLGVWLSGGTYRAFTHFYYIPIMLSALLFGLRGSVPVAVLAAVATGPLMPLDTSADAEQPFSTWVLRGLMFLLVGLIAGAAVQLRERSYDQRLAADLRDTMEGPTGGRAAVDLHLVPLVGEVLDGRRFHIVFQPIYALGDGHLIAVEAMTRFDLEPDLPPDRWFAAAHAAGRGVDLEIAAVEAALDAARELPPHVGLCVNASPATVADQRLLALARQHPTRPLTVEITEHAAIEDYPVLREALAALICLGVDLAVDDAGAGFASLQHIVQLEPDVIKLDMSLTQDVMASPLRRALAASLIEFTDRSGARLVVEGIETVADLSAWAGLGAHAVQGFVVGRPAALPAPGTNALILELRESGSPARA
jgi:EAL domain-containing protein (putative c-di-GMP-specific phosphodiesterase class I)